MQIPRSLMIAAAFGVVWASMEYMKGSRDWVQIGVGFLAFVVIGPVLTWLIRIVMRSLRRPS